MNLLVCLALLQGQGVKPVEPAPKPIVFVTEQDPEKDAWVANASDKARAFLLDPKSGFVVRDTKDFLLVTRKELLGIEEAKRQAPLLLDLAKQASAGDRVISVKDLPPGEGQVLRDMVAARQVPYQAKLANSSDLKFSLGLMQQLDLSRGSDRKSLMVFPGMAANPSYLKASQAAVMRTTADEPPSAEKPSSAEKPVKSEKDVKKPVVSKAPFRSQITFLVGKSIPPGQKLEWVGKAQAILLAESKEAKLGWGKAHDALVEIFQKEADDAFASHNPDRKPRFSDLTTDLQHSAGQYFSVVQRGSLGGVSGPDWLAGANTVNYHFEPTIMLNVDIGGPGYTVSYLTFSCPVGP